jgi:hypothetical protein
MAERPSRVGPSNFPGTVQRKPSYRSVRLTTRAHRTKCVELCPLHHVLIHCVVLGHE